MAIFIFCVWVLSIFGIIFTAACAVSEGAGARVRERVVYILCMVFCIIIAVVAHAAMEARFGTSSPTPLQPEIQITTRPDSTADTLYIYKFE